MDISLAMMVPTKLQGLLRNGNMRVAACVDFKQSTSSSLSVYLSVLCLAWLPKCEIKYFYVKRVCANYEELHVQTRLLTSKLVISKGLKMPS